jgi:regulatory protein YycI of two-component signal transduction system YycFG
MSDLLCIDIFNSLMKQNTKFRLKKNEINSFKQTLLRLFKNYSGKLNFSIFHHIKAKYFDKLLRSLTVLRF